jgi:hypothetical protein
MLGSSDLFLEGSKRRKEHYLELREGVANWVCQFLYEAIKEVVDLMMVAGWDGTP